MTSEELQTLRARLNVGPVVFFRDYLGIAYATGLNYFTGKTSVPDSVARTARMWAVLLETGEVDSMLAALGVTGKPKTYKRKPNTPDLSFLTDAGGTGYLSPRG